MLPRVLSTAVLIGLFAFQQPIIDSEFATVARVALLGAVASIATVVVTATLRLWSAGFWYVTALAVFHVGLAIPYGLGFKVAPEHSAYAAMWFGPVSYRAEATYLCTLALAAFACAYSWSHPPRHESQPAVKATDSGPAEGLVGTALIALGVLTTFGIIVIQDPGALFTFNRDQYIAGPANGGIAAVASFVATFGGILVAAAPPSGRRRLGLALLALFGIWALLMGARSVIMYPALAMIIALARVRPMPKQRVAAMLLIVGLVFVSIVGYYRTTGLANATITATATSPMRAVTEMGFSIRPVVENVGYAHTLNEEPSSGATYVGTVNRALERALGLPRPAGTSDPRLAGNELRQRIEIYEIGYSAVAEAYRNWRTPGVLGVFLIFGMVLGRLDGWRLGKRLPAAFTGIVFFALVFHVRQPSTQIVPTLIVGAVLVWLCSSYNARYARLRSRTHEPTYEDGTTADRRYPARLA